MFRLALVTVLSALAGLAQIADRSASLSELMKSNPGAALRQMASEEQQTFQGSLRSLVFDNNETGQSETRTTLQIGDESYQVYSENQQQFGCITLATVRGFRVGDQILAASVENAGPLDSPACVPLGDQKTVVLLIETPALKLPALITVPFVQGFMSGSATTTVDGYFREVSGGRTTITSTVMGPYTLGAEFPCVSNETMLLAAMAAADAAVDFTQYNRIIMIAPRPPTGLCDSRVSAVSCQGLSTPGDGALIASWAYIASDIVTSASAGVNLGSKALGYGLGIGGSFTRNFGNVAIGAFGTPGTDVRNGDHSIMGDFQSYNGVFPLGHVTARQKVNLGWYAPTNFLNVQATSANIILPASSPTDGVKALRIRRGTGYNEWLWVEHRQFLGPYESTLQQYAPLLPTGVLIHHERPTDARENSYLLHFNPAATPKTYKAAMLTPGAQWDDPFSNLSLQVATVATGMQVTATYGPNGGCVYVLNPTTLVVAGIAGAGAFSITTGPYCEWAAVSASSFINLTSNTIGTGSGNVSFSYTASPGGAARVGTITVGNQVITVNQGGNLQISGKATVSGVALPGVTMTLSGAVSQTTTTSASGNYALLGLPAGSYTVTPTLPGYSFTPASMTFPSLAANQIFDFTATQLAVTLSLDRARLNYAARDTTALTPPQTVLLSYSGSGTTSWTATTNQPWLQVTPAAGTGPTRLTVSVVPNSMPASGVSSATVTVTAPNAAITSLTLSAVLSRIAAPAAPFGAFDTPTNNATQIAGSIAVTGWAMDDIYVDKVQLYRNPIGAEAVQSNGLVFIADTVFVANARPDVEGSNSTLPFQYRGGWGYLMLTTGIPNAAGPQGNGTIKLWAFAVDIEGKTSNLGSKTITLDNASSKKPFGAIDTPRQGGTVSGAAFVNFGWALTPLPNIISLQPTKIWISLDGPFIARVNYGQFRSDIAAGFPGYRNSGSAASGVGAGGHFILDTTQFANGMHNIGWFVVDDVNNQDGIGSRFFFIENGVASLVANPPPPVAIDGPETTAVRLARPRPQRGAVPQVMSAQELERIVIALPDGHWSGAHVINGELQPLPVGSTLDNASGTFYWQLGPGFLGRHELLFTSADGAVHGITVNIEPKTFEGARQ